MRVKVFENDGSPEFIEQLSLSEIILHHMRGPFQAEQLHAARIAFKDRIMLGENDLRGLFYHIISTHWKDKEYDIYAPENYHGYLQFIDQQTPKAIRKIVEESRFLE